MKSKLVSGVELNWVLPGDRNFWSSVWVSPQFQELMTHPSWLRDQVVPLLSQHCINFFTPPPNFRFYFSAWLLNGIMRRQYDNPLIQDLYVLHEALHAATLDDFYAACHNASHTLRVNEIQVSLETECWVYLRQPQWIGKTFDPLWVAQQQLSVDHPNLLSHDVEQTYLNVRDASGWPIDRSSPTWTDQDLWWERRRASLAPISSADQLVRKYERMSAKWIELVKPISNEVFLARQSFRSLVTQGMYIKGVEEWMGFCNAHIDDILPFDHFQLSRRTG